MENYGNLELIRKYFNNELTPQEQQVFNHLEQDSSFQQELADYELLHDILEAGDIMEEAEALVSRLKSESFPNEKEVVQEYELKTDADWEVAGTTILRNILTTPAVTYTDEELVSALRNHDEQAIRYAYETYWPIILYFVLRNNGTIGQARDFYQRCLATLFVALGKENFTLSTSIFKTLVLATGRRLWLEQIRSRLGGHNSYRSNGDKIANPGFKFRGIHKMPDDYKEISSLSLDLEKFHQQMELEQTTLISETQIKEAINQMDEPCRTLLVGWYYQGLTLKQLSVQFNYKSVSIARHQKSKCMAQLKKILLKKP